MNVPDLAAPYREYVRRFGITEPGERMAAMHALDLGRVRFFAYADHGGLRLKAAVTLHGIVTPGGNPNDDWHGFLSQMPMAGAAAERIAWLETDESSPTHGLPGRRVAVLSPDRPQALGIDPARWALVTAPALLIGPDNSATMTAWLLEAGSRSPVRWTITARPGVPASVERTSAADFLSANAGSAAFAEADATERASRLLVTGTDDERWWALQHVSETGDLACVPDVAALLANAGVNSEVKIQATGTLARLADPAAIPSLGAALRFDNAPEVRRAAAQALGRISGVSAVQELHAAIASQPHMMVRAEIVHSLAAHGSAASAALAQIAHSDPNATIRELAQGSVDVLKRAGTEKNR